MTYIRIPQTISYFDLHDKLSFSPKNYEGIFCKNKNTINIGELLKKEIRGREIGSSSYIRNSSCFFVRTGALNKSNFLLEYQKDSILPMKPEDFLNMELKKGQIIISKDGNVGECIVVDKDLKNYMLSGGLVCIDIDEKIKYYCFAFMKSDFLKDQILQRISKGATLLHAKDTRKDCIIPFPNQSNKDEVVRYLSLLAQSVIDKEQEIKSKYEKMMEMISEELKNNQKNEKFNHKVVYDDLLSFCRFDASFHGKKCKKQEFLIKNYKSGFQSIFDLGYTISRGQNLQVTTIGKSIYSDNYHKGFYELILPKNLTTYGTVEKIEYLGNAKKLKTLKKGDIIFGAEGFDKGRSLVVFEDMNNAITNIHGITIQHKHPNPIESIFIKVFLDYLRSIGQIDLYAVGGNGGSLAQKYRPVIPFPNFPENIKKTISDLYYHPASYPSSPSLDTFADIDNTITTQSGITQLDHQIKTIKNNINTIIDKIINDEEVEIGFDFLNL